MQNESSRCFFQKPVLQIKNAQPRDLQIASPDQLFHECVYSKKEKKDSANQDNTQIETTAATTASDQRSTASRGVGFDISHIASVHRFLLSFTAFMFSPISFC